METMAMERNVTSAYEYSSALPFEKAFDQWHYKRWTEENWVSASLKTESKCCVYGRRTNGMDMLNLKLCHVM